MATQNARDLQIAQGWLADGLRKFPDHPALKRAQALLSAPKIPSWHFPMLRDDQRNRAYEAAISHHVRPGLRVLEIGTGSGLLAMMAARAGADHVVSCESNPQIAETARAIIAANGLSERVTVKTGSSTDFTSEDIGGRADVLIAEVFGASLIEEGAVPSIGHARAHLLKPDAVMIPMRGRLAASLADYKSRTPSTLAEVRGFDLSLFMRFRAESRMIRSSSPKLALLGPPTDLFNLDFMEDDTPLAAEVEVDLTSSGGQPRFVVTWLSLELAPGVEYTNAPIPGYESHWGIMLYPLLESGSLEPGDVVRIGAAYDVAGVHVWSLP